MNNESFAYDASTNRIVRISDVEATIVESRSGGSSRQDVIDLIRDRFPDVNAETALHEFERQSESLGLFSAVAHRAVADAPTVVAIRHHLEHHLNSLVLNVTERCNFRCKYCPFTGSFAGGRLHTDNAMSSGIARKAIEFYVCRADAESDLAIAFYGGEPLLAYQTIVDAIQFSKSLAKNKKCTFHITTSGSLLSSRDIRCFLASNEVSLTVSLDGDRRTHDAWRVTAGGQPTHRMVVAGLEAMAREWPYYFDRCIRINAVLSPGVNAENTLEYFRSHPLLSTLFPRLRLAGMDNRGSTITLSPEDRVAAVEQRRRLEAKFIENRCGTVQEQDGLESLFDNELVALAQRSRDRLGPVVVPSGFCVPGGRKLFVNVRGEFGLCERMGEGIIIGNLEDGFDYEKVSEVLKMHISLWSSECSFCHAQRFCGVCPAQVVRRTGEWSREDFDRACRVNRARFKRALFMFLKLQTSHSPYISQLEKVIVK